MDCHFLVLELKCTDSKFAVLDTNDFTIGYVTKSEIEMLRTYGEVFDTVPTNSDAKNYYNRSGVGVSNITKLGIDILSVISLVYKETNINMKELWFSYDDRHLTFDIKELSDKTVYRVLSLLYKYCFVTPVRSKVWYNFPVMNLSIDSVLNSCRINAFVDSKFVSVDDFMYGTDYTIGYMNVLEGFEKFAKAWRNGEKHVVYYLRESDCVGSYHLLNLNSIFCKSFINSYYTELSRLENTSVRNAIREVLSSNGVDSLFREISSK